MPPNRARHPGNQPIINKLEDERHATDSENRKVTLHRAIRSILALEYPITSKADALQVRCVGPVIATEIDVFLRTAQGPAVAAAAAAIARQARAQSTPTPTTSSELAPPASDTQVSPANASVRMPSQAASGAMVMVESDTGHTASESGRSSRGRGNANSALHGMRRPRGSASAPRAQRPYIPKYRSGSFACLLVLLDAYDEGVYRLSLRDFQERGQQYCDEPFVRQKTSDPYTHYDGWSGMSKLTKEGLVARSGNPARFELTMSGLEIAKKCRAMGDDAAARIVQEYEQVNDKVQKIGEFGEEDKGVDRTSLSLQRELTPGYGSNGRANRCTHREERTSGPTGEFALIYPEEFGCLGDELPRRRKNSHKVSSSSVGGGRVNQSHVDRAIRVCERLESDGYKREDCIFLLRKIYDEGSFPRSVDRLYEILSTRLWEQRIEKRRNDHPQHCRRRIFLRGGAIAEEERTPTPRLADIARVSTSQPTHSAPIFQSDSRQSASAPQSIISQDKMNEVIPPVQIGAQNFRDCAASLFLPNAQTRVDPSLLSVSHLTSETVPILNEDRSCVPVTHGTPACDFVTNVIDSDDEDPVVEVNVDVEVSSGGTKQHSRRRQRPNTVGGSISEVQSSVNWFPNSAAGQDTPERNSATDVVDDDVLDLVDTEPAFAPHAQQTSGECAQRETPEHIADETWRVSTGSDSLAGATTASNIILILDSMERGRGSMLSRADVSTMASMLSNHGIRCEVRPLPCGDAIFIAQYEHGVEVVLDYLIERKTLSDFVASMRDGRVARQSYMMKQSQISRRIFVLEGEFTNNQDLRDKPEYAKKLANLEVCDAFYVKKTKDLKDTIWFYSSMFKRLCKQFESKPLHIALKGRALFQDWNVRMKALKNGLTLEQLFSLQLCQLQGISTCSALAILKKGYNTPQALYRAFQNELDPQKRETILVDSEEGITTRASRLLSRFFTATDYGTEVFQE